MQRLIEEIRRRNLLRAAGAYGVGVWLVLQVASVVSEPWAVPSWVMQFLIIVSIIGFPLTIIISWFYEWTPEGIMASDAADAAGYVKPQGFGRLFDYVIIALMATAIGFLVYDRTTLEPSDLLVANAQSIAVLPFVNMSSDPEQDYFSDGISEEILNVLSRVSDLHVTSRSSSFQFKGDDIHIPEVAKKLGVANVLEGSVRKSGNRIRITAQLIDAATDKHLWSETFDRELTDIFAIQDEISQSIVDALYVHLGVEPPPVPRVRQVNAEAYRLYLLGRHNFRQRTPDALLRAVDFFDQSLAIAPDYAPAYSGKADALLILLWKRHPGLSQKETEALAGSLIQKALELDPELADAYASRGLLLMDTGQSEAILRALDRAIELNPNLATAWFWKGNALSAAGDKTGALESWERAHSLDPLFPMILDNLINLHTWLRQFSEAESLLEKKAHLYNDTINYRAIVMQAHRGEWALIYDFFSEAFEKDPDSYSKAIWLALAEVNLKSFDPETTRFPKSVMIDMNARISPDLAWRDYRALPLEDRSSHDAIETGVWTATRLGKHKDVIDLFERLPRYTEEYSGPLFRARSAQFILAPFLVLARQETGDERGAARLLSEIDSFIQVRKEQGTTFTLPIVEARVHALRGQDDLAVAALERQWSQYQRDGYGFIVWWDLTLPFYDALRDREDFQAIVSAVDDHVNKERAKLGWDPVE